MITASLVWKESRVAGHLQSHGQNECSDEDKAGEEEHIGNEARSRTSVSQGAVIEFTMFLLLKQSPVEWHYTELHSRIRYKENNKYDQHYMDLMCSFDV